MLSNMDSDAHHTDTYSTAQVEKMMRAVFGENPSLPVLDLQPEIRALNAQLRGRTAVASAKCSAKQIGQSNALAHLIRMGCLVGIAARGLSARWWRNLRSDLGHAAGLLGCGLVSPPAEALYRAGLAIDAQVRVATSIATRARERARHHGLQYVHHFPARAAQNCAAAADKAA